MALAERQRELEKKKKESDKRFLLGVGVVFGFGGVWLFFSYIWPLLIGHG